MNREAILNEALGSLDNCKSWKVQWSDEIGFKGRHAYSITIKEPEEMLSENSLELYNNLDGNQELDLLSESLSSHWKDIQELEPSYIFHRLGRHSRHTLSIGSDHPDKVPAVWAAIKTLDLSAFSRLDRLALVFLPNLARLPNLRICDGLKSLSLGKKKPHKSRRRPGQTGNFQASHAEGVDPQLPQICNGRKCSNS